MKNDALNVLQGVRLSQDTAPTNGDEENKVEDEEDIADLDPNDPHYSWMSKLTPSMRQSITAARNEALQKAEENFRARDSDGDGELTIKEILQFGSSNISLDFSHFNSTKIQQTMNKMIGDFDDDADGSISMTEWLERTETKFN